MPFIMQAPSTPACWSSTGTLLFIASCWINVDLTHDVGMDQLILPQLLRAIGQPLFSIPLSQLATAGLSPRDTADASALSNMMRNLGGSIGIAMLSTVVDRREHFHFSVLAEAITRTPCARRSGSRRWRRAVRAHSPIPPWRMPRPSPGSPPRCGARPR